MTWASARYGHISVIYPVESDITILFSFFSLITNWLVAAIEVEILFTEMQYSLSHIYTQMYRLEIK